MQKDYDYYQLNSRAEAFYKLQEQHERIKEQQMQISRLLAMQSAKQGETAEIKFDDTDKHLKRIAAAEAKNIDDIAKINKVLQGLVKEQEEDYEIPDFVKKIA